MEYGNIHLGWDGDDVNQGRSYHVVIILRFLTMLSVAWEISKIYFSIVALAGSESQSQWVDECQVR